MILQVSSSWTFCHMFVKTCKTSALRRKVNDPVNENFLSSLHTYKHLLYFLFASSTFCPVFAIPVNKNVFNVTLKGPAN